MEELDYYQNKIYEMMNNDVEAYEIFESVDKMFHGDIALPTQLQQMDDIRLIKDSSPHDSLYNATVALANSQLSLTVVPLGDAEGEFMRANKMEQALQWNWKRANMRGPSRKIWSIAHSALRYDLCVTRVDDLMFYLPKDKSKWSKANKRAARAGRFVITVLPPHKVHFQTSELSGAFCVVSARNLPLPKVIEYYEGIAGTDKTGRQIKAAIAKIKAEYEGDASSLENARFMLYQYTDDETRLDYGHVMETTDDDAEAGGNDDYVFIKTENKLPFMNYTVRGGASDVEADPKYLYHPMLASAHWNDLWTNTVLAKSLVMSDVLRRIREVRETYEGNSAESVAPDDGTGGAKALPPGTTLRRQPPTTIDPQAISLLEGLSNDLMATTSASALGNLSRYSNTAFSTMNAIVQVEMGKLNPQKNIIQDTISDQCYLFCEWTKFTKTPLQAWRTEKGKVGEKDVPYGEEIQISGDDYDLDRLFISASIAPETPTDQLQRMNIVEKLVQMGMAAEEGLEMMNVPHAGLQKDKRALELLKDGVLNALIQQITTLKTGEAQVKIQQMMAQLQQEQMQQQQAQAAQQAQQQGQQGQGGPFAGMQGAAYDPAAGGSPAIQGAAGMGREQMAGQSRSGMDMAV